MATPNTTRWIGMGLLGRPIYGVMTFFSSLDSQPDPNTDYEAFSRFVTTDSYVLKHLFLSDLSIIFVIFGIFALGAYLTRSRAGGMGLWAMVIAVFGQTLFLLIGGVSTFATPQEGQAQQAYAYPPGGVGCCHAGGSFRCPSAEGLTPRMRP